MAAQRPAEISTTRLVLLSLLGLVALALIGTGGLAYGNGIQTWQEHGHRFQGWGMLDWLVGLMGVGAVGIGLLLAGVMLRLLPWRHAPLASLVLSVAAAALMVATWVIYSDIDRGPDSMELFMLHAICTLGLFVAALPPFLHWMKAHYVTEIAAPSQPKIAGGPKRPAETERRPD